MHVKPYKTHKIKAGDDIYQILDQFLPTLEEKSVVAVTSKIVGICEGRLVKAESEEQKFKLAEEEADYYLPPEENQYGIMLSINHNLMVASAGIDASNSDGYFSLWPKDPQKSTDAIREYLVKKHKLKHLGVILTDSKLSPLRWGVTGYAVTHSGFKAFNSYIGKPDLFGRRMHMEQANVMDSLASTSVAVMGEGAEQQPLAVITDASFVEFQDRKPNQEELDALTIDIKDDVYASMLSAVSWRKGRKGS
ncbi:MAG: coenzyme F420-0:L-glutamate ligase [Candidatus Levybacteria bacterium]|nr:coenzyme F420-0:L-glutamate ligase [Candidatus Levybacteria bacterium]